MITIMPYSATHDRCKHTGHTVEGKTANRCRRFAYQRQLPQQLEQRGYPRQRVQQKAQARRVRLG